MQRFTGTETVRCADGSVRLRFSESEIDENVTRFLTSIAPQSRVSDSNGDSLEAYAVDYHREQINEIRNTAEKQLRTLLIVYNTNPCEMSEWLEEQSAYFEEIIMRIYSIESKFEQTRKELSSGMISNMQFSRRNDELIIALRELTDSDGSIIHNEKNTST